MPGGLRKQVRRSVRRSVRRASDVPSDVLSDVVKTGQTYVSIKEIKKYPSDSTSDGTSDTRLTARLTCFLRRQKDLLEPSGPHALAPELPAAPGGLALVELRRCCSSPRLGQHLPQANAPVADASRDGAAPLSSARPWPHTQGESAQRLKARWADDGHRCLQRRSQWSRDGACTCCPS